MIDFDKLKQELAIAKERQQVAERHAQELAKANQALQATIDAMSEITHPDQIVPRVLEIAAKTFNSKSCAVFKNSPSGRIWLQYWFSDDRIYLPEEMLQLDPQKFALVRMLAGGFEAPDDYLGGPTADVIGPVLLDHVAGTSVAEFDTFAQSVGWDMELNIGVASKGIRAFTLCIYRGREYPFTEQEVILGEALAKQLGLAMETCRLIEEARQAAIVREREHIAREIHDTLAQGFTAILIHLKTLRKQLSFPPDAIDTLDTLQHVAQDNLIEARRSLWKLRPRVLSQGNIVDGLRRLIDSAGRAGDMKIDLTIDPRIHAIPDKVEDELIRIAQEALQNALRYGEGTEITIELQAMDLQGINLSIRDNGRGFNTNAVTPGYGLIGMRERADYIGAAMTIISEPGYGTQIIVSWMPPQPNQGSLDGN